MWFNFTLYNDIERQARISGVTNEGLFSSLGRSYDLMSLIQISRKSNYFPAGFAFFLSQKNLKHLFRGDVELLTILFGAFGSDMWTWKVEVE